MATESGVMRARLHLIRELHAGIRAPGARISVKDVAAAIRLSHIPVREALARLAGEGAVVATDNRGGFAVPRFTPNGLADAIAFSGLLIDAAVSGADRQPVQDPAPLISADPVAATETMIHWLVIACSNRQIIGAITRIGLVLAPYRRVEAQIIPSWGCELHELAAAVAAGRWRPTASRYWQRRIDAAGSMIDAVERAHAGPDIFRI